MAKKNNKSLIAFIIVAVVGTAVWYFFIKEKPKPVMVETIPEPKPAQVGSTIVIDPQTNLPIPANPVKTENTNPNSFDYTEFANVLPSGKVKLSWMGLVWNPTANKSVGNISGGVSTEVATVRNIGVKYTVSPITGIKTSNYFLHKSYISSSFGKDMTYSRLKGLGITDILLIN